MKFSYPLIGLNISFHPRFPSNLNTLFLRPGTFKECESGYRQGCKGFRDKSFIPIPLLVIFELDAMILCQCLPLRGWSSGGTCRLFSLSSWSHECLDRGGLGLTWWWRRVGFWVNFGGDWWKLVLIGGLCLGWCRELFWWRNCGFWCGFEGDVKVWSLVVMEVLERGLREVRGWCWRMMEKEWKKFRYIWGRGRARPCRYRHGPCQLNGMWGWLRFDRLFSCFAILV